MLGVYVCIVLNINYICQIYKLNFIGCNIVFSYKFKIYEVYCFFYIILIRVFLICFVL